MCETHLQRLAIVQKSLNGKISPFPSQQTVEQAFPRGKPTGTRARALYLDSESRRARQEGRDGDGGALTGDAGVFLTMR